MSSPRSPSAPLPSAVLAPSTGPRSARNLALAGLALLALGACRNASGDQTAASAILPSTEGVNGCAGASPAVTSASVPATVAVAGWTIGASSQIAAARGSEILYATGDNGTVVAIDTDAAPLTATSLVGAGALDALLALSGVSGAAEISGIAVLDASTLLVVESTSNTLVSVDRTTPNTIGFWAGLPSNVPGFADGAATGGAGLARFSFSEPTQICPTGDVPQRVFVADAGNHAIRVVDASGFVSTLAGAGSAAFNDGSLGSTFLDTPTGIAVSCDNRLVVTERGASGFGNRLRALSIGAPSPFGGFFGSSATLAGDGTNATTEGAALTGAQLAHPVAPVVATDGVVYWIDSTTGVLRRRAADGTCDCPLNADCASALPAGDFPPGHAFSMALTEGGKLFVLDATAGVLWRVNP